jgi:DNA-binding PucR family transcriptional regulator
LITGNFSGSEFKLYLSLLARLIERTPIIESEQVGFLFNSSIGSAAAANDDDEMMEEEEESTQGLTFVNEANERLVNNEDLVRKELFACLNSKEIGERLNVLFQNRHQLNEESLSELCRHISSLCFFVLMKANVKIYAST